MFFVKPATFIDASSWQVLPWFSSGGTRAKCVLQDDDGNLWYFKCSEYKEAKEGKPAKYYKFEFWSEVIAFQIGKALGLDVLRYDVAFHSGQVGCICPLMIKQDEELLVEFGRYMTALNPEFNPADRRTHAMYTFDFLIQTLEQFKLDHYLDRILETILFDALIGNTDRHQENWALIARSTFPSEAMHSLREEVKEGGFRKIPYFLRQLISPILNKNLDDLRQEIKLSLLKQNEILRVAPIYDNGSSLGRELTDERIEQYLSDEVELHRYLNQGKSELHWEGKKISHFAMIENLISSSYLDSIQSISGFLRNLNADLIVNTINNIDKDVPVEHAEYVLPGSRKEFIIKVLLLRAQKLGELFGDGRV